MQWDTSSNSCLSFFSFRAFSRSDVKMRQPARCRPLFPPLPSSPSERVVKSGPSLFLQRLGESPLNLYAWSTRGWRGPVDDWWVASLARPPSDRKDSDESEAGDGATCTHTRQFASDDILTGYGEGVRFLVARVRPTEISLRTTSDPRDVYYFPFASLLGWAEVSMVRQSSRES